MVKITITFDPGTRHLKVDSHNSCSPDDTMLLLSQTLTNYLLNSTQQKALLINPFEKAEGLKNS